MNKIIHTSKLKRNLGSALRVSTVIVGLLVLAACASSPKAPTEELQAADLAIANADQAGVVQYASPELAEAREKLAAARVAVQAKKMDFAQRLAEEARVDAELATAKGEAAKAAAVNDELRKNTHVLKQEMNRKIGDPQ
jgi:hypothetical protein